MIVKKVNPKNIPHIADPILVVLFIVGIIFKAIAFWRSARSNQKIWFVVFMIISNDFGIVELIYLIWFAKEKLTMAQVKGLFKRS